MLTTPPSMPRYAQSFQDLSYMFLDTVVLLVAFVTSHHAFTPLVRFQFSVTQFIVYYHLWVLYWCHQHRVVCVRVETPSIDRFAEGRCAAGADGIRNPGGFSHLCTANSRRSHPFLGPRRRRTSWLSCTWPGSMARLLDLLPVFRGFTSALIRNPANPKRNGY